MEYKYLTEYEEPFEFRWKGVDLKDMNEDQLREALKQTARDLFRLWRKLGYIG